MPRFLESALRHEATKKGLTGEAADRYIYGAMAHIQKKGKKSEMTGADAANALANRKG